MKCHLILNPRSKGGKAASQFEKIFRLMTVAGIEYDYIMADTYAKIREASINAHAGEYDAIVAVGGDGTINAVVNGFYDENGTTRSDKKMGVIYTGTSPDFCKSYGVPLGLEEAVNTIRMGVVRKIRIGRIRLRTDPARDITEFRYFSCCASIGIGAMVAAKANRFRKHLGDTSGTLAAILSSLFKFHPVEMIIKTGSEERLIARVTNIFVGRTKYIASGLRVKEPMADNDGRFYIVCVKNLNLARLPGLLRQLYSGNISNSPVLDLSYSDRVSIFSKNEGTGVEFDGDPAGFIPCTIEIAISPLNLIVNNC